MRSNGGVFRIQCVSRRIPGSSPVIVVRIWNICMTYACSGAKGMKNFLSEIEQHAHPG